MKSSKAAAGAACTQVTEALYEGKVKTRFKYQKAKNASKDQQCEKRRRPVSLTKRTSHEACEITEKDISQPYTGAVAKE
ncbi:hypothetical protein P5673_021026, partial [Acropora cervicornis]